MPGWCLDFLNLGREAMAACLLYKLLSSPLELPRICSRLRLRAPWLLEPGRSSLQENSLTRTPWVSLLRLLGALLGALLPLLPLLLGSLPMLRGWLLLKLRGWWLLVKLLMLPGVSPPGRCLVFAKIVIPGKLFDETEEHTWMSGKLWSL